MKAQIEKIIADPLFIENAAWQRRHFHTEETIIQEGDEGNALFFVQQGTLRVTVQVDLPEKNSIQQGLSDLKTGDVFGEICLHGSYVRTASVKAVSEGTVIEIDGAALNEYLDRHPELGYQFFKSLFEIYIKRLDLANNRVGSLFAWGLKAHGIEKHL